VPRISLYRKRAGSIGRRFCYAFVYFEHTFGGRELADREARFVGEL